MTFNSFEFMIFFVIVLILLKGVMHFTKNTSIRNILLLTASYYFYGTFSISFLAILIYITLVNYIAAIAVGKAEKHRKWMVGVSVVLSLTPLIVYKYIDFILIDIFQLSHLHENHDWLKSLILPIGISFYTFQALTYTIDVYRGKMKSRRSYIDVSLFIAFFPTLLSGPIEKARNLLLQIETLNLPNISSISQGTVIFIWGVFKKIVIADRLGTYVDWAYGSMEYVSGSTLALAAIFYSIQIYCDFSGYSDMALGVARCLGFNVTRNFNYPYFATTIKEFWHRWHISLTSWFTEYVYFSLGGNRVKYKIRWIFNISVIFILSGIWHGAAWNFLVWGILHALFYLTEYFLGLQRKNRNMSNKWGILSGLVVFILVTIAWIFFRIEDFSSICYIIKKIFTDWSITFSVGASIFTFACNLLLFLIFLIYEWLLYSDAIKAVNQQSKSYSYQNILWVISLLLMMGLFGVASDNFVYFQF